MADDILNPTVTVEAHKREQQCRARLFTQPQDIGALHMLGRLCAQSDRLDEGRELMAKALAIESHSAELHLSAARMAMQAGDIEQAEAGFRRALALRSAFAPALTGLGQVAQGRQQWATAEQHFRDAARATPDDVEVLLGLGEVREARGDPEQAARWFMRATQLYPQHVGALTHYAQALLNHGSPQAAARPAIRALEIEPGYLPAHLLLGRIELLRGRFDAAEAAFRTVLQREDAHFDALAGLGHALRARGQIDAAVAAYDTALKLNPDAETLVTSRAVCLLQHQRSDDAVRDLRAWITSHPRCTDPRMLLADVYDQSGRAEQALLLWQAAVDADAGADDAVAQAELARRREYLGDVGAAQAAADASSADQRPSTLLLRARVALRDGDSARAQRELLAIVSKDLRPELALERLRLLGVVHDHNARHAEAVLAFREAQRIGAQPLPALVDADAVAPRLRSLRSLEELESPRSPTPILLLGLPGTQVEGVGALLGDRPDVAVRADRFGEQFDLFGDADDPRLLEPLAPLEVSGLARRYVRALSRALPAPPALVIDWLPLLDARVLVQARRALPGLRAIRVDGDPESAFLRWLAFGWADLHAVDPLVAARWWRRAQAHLDVAEDIIPVTRVDGAALLVDPAKVGVDLARWLGVDELGAGPRRKGQQRVESMLAAQFPLAEPAAYRGVLGEAFAALR